MSEIHKTTYHICIIKNIIEYCKIHNIKLDLSLFLKNDSLNYQYIINAMGIKRYIELIGKIDDKPIVFYIIDKDGFNTVDLKKLLDNYEKYSEIIFIADNDYINKNNINNILKQYNNLKFYKYEIFKLNPFNCHIIPKHRILSQEESNKLLKECYTTKIKLPKILINEIIIVWLRANKSDIIEITRNDIINGVSLYYRIVV